TVVMLVLYERYTRELFFFFSCRRRHTRFSRDWSSDVCSSVLPPVVQEVPRAQVGVVQGIPQLDHLGVGGDESGESGPLEGRKGGEGEGSGEEGGRGFRFHRHVLLIAMALIWTRHPRSGK